MLLQSSYTASYRFRRQGFTLIELLMVMAVIMVLAGIAFGITKGVHDAQARTKAKAELAAISQGIEQFKLRYGDYPWHQSGGSWGAGGVDNTNQMLLYALTGRLVIRPVPDPSNAGQTKMTAIKIDDSIDDAEVQRNPKFIDVTRFTVQYDGSGNPVSLIDPWGRPYKYWYKWDDNPSEWELFGYHLYTLGPDGAEDNSHIEQSPRTGDMRETYREGDGNADNIFAGE